MGDEQGRRFAALRTPLTAYATEQRPLLRGWFHAVAAVVSVIVTVAWGMDAALDQPRNVAALIFGLSMIALYTSSAVYNLRNWRGRAATMLQILDHAMIFVLIAGTYTPLCVIVMRGPLRVGLLATVWSLAAVGAACGALTFRLPRWSMTALYIGMGWLGVVAVPHLVRQLPLVALGMCVAGGVFYTIGGAIYALRRPDPFPRVFGFHEIFHLFVIAGSVAFAWLIWGWVLPLSRP